MELETVLYRVEGNVGIVSLNRTKAMNSLNKQIFADLTVAFEEAKKDDNVRCVIMNGEGRAFCAGGDIAEMKGITTEEAFFDFMTVAGEFTTLLNTFPKPVIAAAHGAIAGAGTSLVMAADIALVADNAMFIVAFGQVGLIPDCACHYLLPRVVGPNRAKELMLTQRAVKADEMLTLGIANRVVPADQLMDEAMKLATKIAKGPLNCYTMSKSLMNKAHETTLADLLKEETAMQAAARMNPNAEEGLGAFLEKRKANFQ
ncbi:MAG: enoyl-CoA hydratase/isomerase family protein [Clostridiales bacterium]|nr:enoyl-CoA hydratase/isomerase family protein [Clostridiales bacterium]